MIRHYITIAFRQISRNKLFSIINIAGLAIAMTCFLFIYEWVSSEISCDRFHRHSDRSYKMVVKDELATKMWYFANVPPALAPSLAERFPEIEHFARLRSFEDQVEYKLKRFNEKAIYYGDPAFFKIFDFPWIKGDPDSGLDDPHSVAISASCAVKYFGDQDPIGKILVIDKTEHYTVRGLMKDFPDNSSLQIDFFVPVSTFLGSPIDLESWGSFAYSTYILLKENVDAEAFESKIASILNDELQTSEFTLQLQSTRDMHLYELSGEPGLIIQVRILILIGIFILILAWVNFMNLSTARSIARAREMGLRRVAGASRNILIRQILADSLNIAFLAALHAVILVELLSPLAERLTGVTLSFSILQSSDWIMVIGMVLASGVVAGIYPAIVFTAYSPVEIISNDQINGKGGLFRKILVVFQFMIAITLMICTLSVQRQLHYMTSKDTGIHSDDVIYMALNEQLKEQYEAWTNRLDASPLVFSHTRTFQMPSNNLFSVNVTWKGQAEGENYLMNMAIADYDYLKTFGLYLDEGRDFSRDYGTDSSAYIINQSLASMIGGDEVLGMTLSHNNRSGEVIGIVKDFHFRPMSNLIEPLALIINPDYYQIEVLRFNEGSFDEGLRFLRETYESLCQDYQFNYKVFEDDFAKLYVKERALSNQLLLFALLAVLIACLGLFGLATFMAQQNTRQIGIRKVLGASVLGLTTHFTLRFIVWVALSIILAFPISFLFMQKWLGQFAYRTEMVWWIYLLAAMIAILISSITIGMQAWIASSKNPVNAIKHS